MKKLLIIIAILAVIFVGMLVYRNQMIGAKDKIGIQEIQELEDYISKIYMWEEVTNEALPSFNNINEANELWIWEVVKKNLEEYELSYEEIEEKTKEVFGESFEKQFPKEGNESFKFENEKYIATETKLDEKEDQYLMNEITKTKDGYIVEIIEYLEDYQEEGKVIVKNLEDEELGKVSTNDSETKIQEIVKNNIDRFTKKKIHIKKEQEKLIIQKVEKN